MKQTFYNTDSVLKFYFPCLYEFRFNVYAAFLSYIDEDFPVMFLEIAMENV